MKVVFKKEIGSHDNVEISFSVEADHIGDIIEEFKRFLLACGYHQETIKEYLENDDEG